MYMVHVLVEMRRQTVLWSWFPLTVLWALGVEGACQASTALYSPCPLACLPCFDSILKVLSFRVIQY